MRPEDMPIPPLAADVLNTITTRSAAGEGIVRIIKSMRLGVAKTLEQLRLYHVDEVITAKKIQRERI